MAIKQVERDIVELAVRQRLLSDRIREDYKNRDLRIQWHETSEILKAAIGTLVKARKT